MEGRPLDDDAQLIDSARGGDIGAFEQLVARYQQIAVRVAHVMCGPDDAGDVAQEAFVKAWHALGRFRSGSAFRPWLLTIVANEARNTRRAAGRRARLALRASEGRPSVAAAPSTEEAALGEELRQLVLAAVATLSDAHRDVISCRFFAGLSEAETAAVLGCRRGTVKSRMSRALAGLRSHLDPAFDEGVLRA
ncbi:MAG: RNA polymerase sigma factor [Acidimicrobiia bacterium]